MSPSSSMTWTIRAHSCCCARSWSIDLYWLQLVNKERQADGSPPVDYQSFEALMDLTEKEWFHLTKDLVRPETNHLTPEESACAICNEEECDNSNAIVFCDGCNLAVHQDCYGIPYVPEGQWLCRRCMLSPSTLVKCIFCPSKKGAFKQTTSNKWAHLLCALWIPEVGVANTVYMEPIEGVSKIPRSRWRLICTVCKKREGACIQCADRNCFTAFHVTCARKSKFCMVANAVDDADSMKAYCERHSRLYDASDTSSESSRLNAALPEDGHAAASTPVERVHVELPPPSPPSPLPPPLADGEDQVHGDGVPKSKLFRRMQIPAVVNNYIAERVYAQAKYLNFPNKKQFVNKLFRYWALKREMHRGAPLLKRLHLEPWTFRAATETVSDQEEKRREMEGLRAHFEKLRMIVGMTHRRERFKLKRNQLIKAILELQLFPVTSLFACMLHELKTMDKLELFWEPVDAESVPDYFTVITNPMDFGTMEHKVDQYDELQDFEADVNLVFRNAMMYNTADTAYYKAAHKLQQEFHSGQEKRHLQVQLLRDSVFMDPDLDVDVVLDDTPPPKEPTPPLPEGVEAFAETPLSSRRKRLSDDFATPVRRSARTIRHAVDAELQLSDDESSSSMGTPSVDVPPVLQPPIKRRRVIVISPEQPGGMKRITLEFLKTQQADLPPIQVGHYVWAKFAGFPYFPGVVVDPKSDRIPAVTKAHTHPEDALLIQYFESKPVYSWLVPDKFVLHLGRQELVDRFCLHFQKFTRTSKKEVHEAFRRACRAGELSSPFIEEM